MRKKLFTLMTLLLTAVTGAWADTDICSGNLSSVDADHLTGSASGTNCTIAWNSINNSTVTGSDGNTYWKFNTSAYVTLTLSGDETFQANDRLIVKMCGSGKNKTIGFKLKTTDGNGSTGKSDATDGTTPQDIEYSLVAADIETDSKSIKIYRNGADDRFFSFTVVRPTATAPSAPGFSPNGGDINGNEVVSLTGTATTFYYQWSTNASASLTISSGGWTAGTSAIVPNETGTQYLYAYASNGAGLNSAVVRSDAFTITKDTYKFNAPVKYALAEGDAFTSGQTVSVKDGTKEVATITYGEAGGNAFAAAVAEGTIDGYSAMTAGNGTNGDKTGGTWYTIIPKFDCVISVGVALNKDKSFYIKEDGTSLTAYNGITVDAKYTGTYEFKATANSEYKIYCAGSKLGFYGFTMSPYVTATIGSTGWATFASDKILDFKKTTPALTATYIVTGGAEGKIQVESVDEPIAAGQGMLLKGDAATYYISVGASATFDASENKLVGVPTGSVTVTSSSNSGFNYVMAKSGDKAVFKRIGSNSATITAGKAYLALTADPGTAASSELSLEIVDNSSEDITTGISAIEHSTLNIEHSEVYNLNGQRVANPTKGLYIVNGKKVIVK